MGELGHAGRDEVILLGSKIAEIMFTGNFHKWDQDN